MATKNSAAVYSIYGPSLDRRSETLSRWSFRTRLSDSDHTAYPQSAPILFWDLGAI